MGVAPDSAFTSGRGCGDDSAEARSVVNVAFGVHVRAAAAAATIPRKRWVVSAVFGVHVRGRGGGDDSAEARGSGGSGDDSAD